MSNLKRKAASGQNSADHPIAKSVRHTRDARASPKSSSGRQSQLKTASHRSDAPRPVEEHTQSAVVTRLKEDKPAFPRGGGSVLTPLEQKQIQLQAKADAFREEEFDVSHADKTKKQERRKAASSTSLRKSLPGKTAPESTVKVESLNFKKLVKGSLALGQITKINRHELEVALPNNLLGYVSILAVSEKLSSRIRNLVPQNEEQDEEEINSSAQELDLNLDSIFTVGQFLRVCVVSTTDEAGTHTRSSRRIELTLQPSDSNAGLNSDDIVAHGTVMASVINAEDKGWAMDLGIPDLRAFLPKKEIDPTMNLDRLQPGAVFLCQVLTSNGKIAQLTLLQKKLGSRKAVPQDAKTITAFLPGTLVDVLVCDVDKRGLVGKVLGHLDVTADVIHSGAGPDGKDLESCFKVGSRAKARIICNFPAGESPKCGISFLDHIIVLEQKHVPKDDGRHHPLAALPISFVEKCTVRHVESEIGLFVDTGTTGLSGFVHISRVKDGKVDALYEHSGPFQIGSEHRGRIVGYNEMDGLAYISFEQSLLDRKYLRFEDVPIGAVVSCIIEKLIIKPKGVDGLIVKVDNGITGLIPGRHMADVQLKHPEKKFREGMKVKARVLSINAAMHRMRLTLKKTLVNSEAPVVKAFDEISVGMQFPGTIVNLQVNGAHLQFYGPVRGYLPVSEMSEAYIREPAELFRLGQVINVHVREVNAASRRLVVSCKDPEVFGLDKQNAIRNLEMGALVSAKVTQKTEDQILLELMDNQLKATLPVGHLMDKSSSKCESALRRISVGQTLSGLMVLEKDEQRHVIVLTQKPSLIQAFKDGRLPAQFEDVQIGMIVAGFVRNITSTAVFVQFAGNLHALLPKARLPFELQLQPDYGLHRNASIEVRVLSLIKELRRILVAPASSTAEEVETANRVGRREKPTVPQDGLTAGSVTQARVTSVKQTQLNVQLVDNVQGRIDISQIFDNWDDIDDPKNPLAKFHKKQLLSVKVIGVHHARDHRFLPISHRTTHSVLELTAKPSDLLVENPEMISWETIKVGDMHLAFVNNATSTHLWVNLSPSIRGRVAALDTSDDLSQVNDLGANFPIGSALKVRVVDVNTSSNHLDLSAKSSTSPTTLAWEDLKQNMILPGKITKVDERQVVVKIGTLVSGPVHLPDLEDDFDEIDTTKYSKNDIVRVSVVEIDAGSQRLRLSLRPSRILSSSLPVADREISRCTDCSPGDMLRGFVKNVSDKGLFVALGGQATAHIKIRNLSDSFLKEWKDLFQVGQLVKGRVISVDPALAFIEMSLRASVVDEHFTPYRTFNDIKKGQIVTGRIRKVEAYGVFIVVDNSANVSGLCHRSQMAEKLVKDATKLYREGDLVKAAVLDIDPQKNKITFGLKPSLIDTDDSDMESDGSEAGAPLEEEQVEMESDTSMDEGQGEGNLALRITGTDNAKDRDNDEVMSDGGNDKFSKGISIGKKLAWAANPFEDSDVDAEESAGDDGDNEKKTKKKRRQKASIQIDKTAELDAHGPQSASDYERLLLGQPDSSELWIAYMAFQLQVSELNKAREVAERAIKSINIREEVEKLNVWVAYLNLEVTYGSEQNVEEVFKRARQHNNEQEVFERLASIYIQSGKVQRADELFEAMLRKFGAKSPSVWTNYAHFLHFTLAEPARARALLPRATQQLDKRHQQAVVSRFAAMEFRAPKGEPERGRTMFEGLLSVWPKKGDLWSQLLDLEQGIAGASANPSAVQDVFERRTRVKGLKPQQAEKWFRRWTSWEESIDPKRKEKIMAKAQEWVSAYKARKEAELTAEADEEMDG